MNTAFMLFPSSSLQILPCPATLLKSILFFFKYYCTYVYIIISLCKYNLLNSCSIALIGMVLWMPT